MIELEVGAVLRFRGCRRQLECVSGVLWVTSEGDSEDRFLVAGEGLRIAGGGLVLVQAWEAAVAEVRHVGSHPLSWLSRWGRRTGHAACRPARE